MAEQIIPVDVEKIMEEIRQEIKEKGYNDSMLSFRDVDGSEQLKELTSDVFDLGEMERVVQQMNMRSHVEWYHPVEGTAFANFFKKVIRRLCRFMLIPIVDHQNAYNSSAAQSMNQALSYIKEQQKIIANLEERIKVLEDKK